MPRPQGTLIHRILGYRYLFAVNLVLVLFLAIAFGREYIRNHEIQSDIDSLQQQAQELAARNLQMTELKTAFQTESFIEREARLKLGLKRPGEELVIVQNGQGVGVDESRPQDPLAILQEERLEGDTIANPSKWWYYFFDRDQFDALAE